jgi:tRNA(fMet)-specific endonuclease VapC
VAAEPPASIFTTVITVEEQIDGWYSKLRQANSPAQIQSAYRRLAETIQYFNDIVILNYTVSAISRFQGLFRQKLNVGRQDLRIASIALENRGTVVTCNIGDFKRVPGLLVEDWSQ